MKKTILIGALLFSSISGFASDMDRCKSSIKLKGISSDKGLEASYNKDFKGACIYVQLGNSFVEDAMANCPAELQAKLQEAYIQGKRAEAIVCNIK